MLITNIPTELLAEIIAGLVKQGLTFNCRPRHVNAAYVDWTIELTGGF